MANTITESLLEAYAARCAVGESVTYDGATLTVPQINRAPSERDLKRLNFGEGTDSVVELPPTLTEPEIGDVIEDQFSRRHRIAQVHFTGAAWVCGCVTSAES